MIKFPQPEYCLIKIFYKVPYPIFTWPLLVTIVYFIASHKVILSLQFISDIEHVRFYLGNWFFSVLAIFLIIKIYEQNVAIINKWIKETDILGEKDNVINKLNTIHNYFSGKGQFIIGIGIIIREILAYFLIPEIIAKPEVIPEILPAIVIDAITMFLVYSLFLSSICVISCLYITGSNGVKVKYPFDIRNAYRSLASLAVKNAVIVSVYWALYSSAIAVWTYQSKQYILAVTVIYDVMIITSIFIIFVIGIAGIRQGIAMSKQVMLSSIKTEMDMIQPIYTSLIDSKNATSLRKLYNMFLIQEVLLKRGKNIEEINEWMFDIGSVIKVVLTSIFSLIITAVRVILNI